MSTKQTGTARFRSFKEFYQFYKGLFLTQAGAAAALRKPPLLLSGIITAYAFAWAGHFFVEHNRPATFKYPLQSLVGDFTMFFSILTGQEPLVISNAPNKDVNAA